MQVVEIIVVVLGHVTAQGINRAAVGKGGHHAAEIVVVDIHVIKVPLLAKAPLGRRPSPTDGKRGIGGVPHGVVTDVNLFTNTHDNSNGASGEPCDIVEEVVGDGDVDIGVGLFIQAIINFLITAFVLFLVVKFFNSFKKKEEEKPAAPPAVPEDVKLLTEIRDLLKNK